jgi:hypothetical protein
MLLVLSWSIALWRYARFVIRANAHFLLPFLNTYSYSLLETGLRELGRNDPGDDAMLRLLQPIFILLKEHFQPRLNENGLLAEYAAAKLCLDCMMALQQLRPDLWENESIVFDVVGVWLVSVEAEV